MLKNRLKIEYLNQTWPSLDIETIKRKTIILLNVSSQKQTAYKISIRPSNLYTNN